MAIVLQDDSDLESLMLKACDLPFWPEAREEADIRSEHQMVLNQFERNKCIK